MSLKLWYEDLRIRYRGLRSSYTYPSGCYKSLIGPYMYTAYVYNGQRCSGLCGVYFCLSISTCTLKTPTTTSQIYIYPASIAPYQAFVALFKNISSHPCLFSVHSYPFRSLSGLISVISGHYKDLSGFYISLSDTYNCFSEPTTPLSDSYCSLSSLYRTMQVPYID